MAQWKWYIYIIECNDETYYTGMTWRPDRRWVQHLSGLGSKYTARHGVKKSCTSRSTTILIKHGGGNDS
ncbi:GIY-YIG nuclease family protein [Candidatus Parcubacteria bacterium]|nr:GIY-YIG nuclease family protein [Candidatus Parcubacteria bacterium]